MPIELNQTNKEYTMLSNILNKRISDQRELELSESMSGFQSVIRECVDAITSKDVLIEDWYAYVAQLSLVDSKFAEHHAEILGTLKKSVASIVDTSLSVLIQEASMSYSYVDLDVVALKLGKKLANKSYRKDNTIVLSLGLNVVNYLVSAGMVKIGTQITADKHRVYTLHVNKALVSPEIKAAAMKVRAGSPMICRPLEHTATEMGGYLLNQKTLLGTYSPHQLQSPLVCEALNYMQDVAYELREEMYGLEDYAHTDRFIGSDGLSLRYGEIAKLENDLVSYSGKTLYFPVSCDDRLRIYDRSSYISYQGDKYQKAMLQFRDKEVCTESGLDMLRIAIVNEIYSDKLEYSDALVWWDKNADSVVDMVIGNPIAQALYADYLVAVDGGEIGSITHWDATNSGLQIYSLIGRDMKAASLCNVLDDGGIADAYRALADALNQATETEAFSRGRVKKAFMTFLYGAQEDMILHRLEDKKNGIYKGIKEFFPDGWSDELMWKTFTDSMIEIAPAAIKLMNLMYKYNRADTSRYTWTLPDGGKVEVTNTKNVKVRGWRLNLDGATHEGSISTLVEGGDKYSRSLAPNIIHSIDAYIVREVVRRVTFDISVIHDSFGVHPNNALALAQIIREVYAYVLEKDMLTDILSQIDEGMTARALAKGLLFKGELSSEDILASRYIVR